MFRLLVSSMLALTTFAQLPELNQFSDMIKQMESTIGQPLSVEDCAPCNIVLCGNTIDLPTDTDCNDLNDEITIIKESLFKNSKDCEDKAEEYICKVFIGPFKKYTNHMCNIESDDDLLEELYEESFCEANENCEDLSRCSWINIDCEYDSDILPYIGESSSLFDESECPHNNLSEKIKRFFEDYWKDIVISGIMDTLSFMVIIVIIICISIQGPRVVQDRNMV